MIDAVTDTQIKVIEPYTSKTHDAVICRKCTTILVYWASPNVATENAFKHGLNPFFRVDGMPTCSNCSGDTKIASGIVVSEWCDECGKHRSHCKCNRSTWRDI